MHTPATDDRFDHAWWAMATVGLDGRFLRVNQPICDRIGRSRDELVGMSVFDLVAPAELAEERRAVQALLAGENHLFRYPRSFRFPDGNLWEGTLLVSVVRSDDGEPLHLHVRLEDPIEQRRPPDRIARLEGDFPLSIDQMRVGIAIIGLDGVALRANPALCAIAGRSDEELRSIDLLSLTHPDDAAADVTLGARAWAGEFDSYTIEKRLVRPDGSEVWVQQEVTFVRDEAGDLLHLVGQVIDIDARKAAERAVEESRERWVELLDRLPVGVVDADADGRILSANPAAVAITGNPAVGPGFDAYELIHPDDVPHAVAIAAANIATGTDYHVEFRIVRPDGEIRWVRSDVHPVLGPAGVFLGLTGTWLDVTELKAAESMLREQATHDPLTGLANRVLFFEALIAAIDRARRSGAGLAVLFIDLDGFKAVNDGFGHRAGDTVLELVADRIGSSVRGGDLVARFGGDEFIVVCEQLATGGAVDEARALAERVVAQMAEPFPVSDTTVSIGASVGVALWRDGIGPDDLVGAADRAVYESKAAGRGRVTVA